MKTFKGRTKMKVKERFRKRIPGVLVTEFNYHMRDPIDDDYGTEIPDYKDIEN